VASTKARTRGTTPAPVPNPSPAPTPDSTLPEAAPTRSRRRNVLIAGGALIVLALVGGFVYVATRTPINLIQNPSLEDGTASELTCWALGGYGTNTFTWARASDAHSGSYAETLDVTNQTNGDRKLVTTQDDGTCAPAASAGRSYAVSVWYKATREPVIFVYYRDRTGVWVYWTQAGKLPISSAWTRASYTTPTVPAGATNISIGLGLDSVGSITMDDFELVVAG
jgi:hypothetical protein